MVKDNKLIFGNILVVLLIVAVYVFGDYLSNYPLDTRHIKEGLKYVEWDFLVYLIVGTSIISLLIAFLLRKGKGLKITYIQIAFVLNSGVLVYLLGTVGYLFISDVVEVSRMRAEYRKQAKEDIGNDNVTFNYAGLEVEPYEPSVRSKIDSIYKQYGVRYYNSDCMLNDNDVVAQETYDELVKPYLVKRNGTDWQDRMNEQIDIIVKGLPQKSIGN